MNAITEVPNGALMGFIERAARDPEFDVAKFALLLDKQQEMQRERARQEFNAGMADCQSQMEPVLRTATNPGVKSKYAKLEDIDRDIRPIYTAHGFSVRFGSDVPPQPGWMRITCTVAHKGGYSEQNYLDSPVSTQGSQGGRMAMTPVQAVGSVVTYLRRYLLGMVFNIVQADVVGHDDDGEGGRDADAGENMRSAAAGITRSPRVTEPPPRSTPRIPRSGAEWTTWVDRLQVTLATLRGRAEYHAITDAPAFEATVNAAPPQVKRDIDAILADTYDHLPVYAPIENDPTISGDELPEIKGQDKVLAG